MFKRILIANRGEIALRILRACQELGIETVIVYSEADRNMVYLHYADETICIGPPRSADSYLDIPKIISAAEVADVEAIHPGYGFLAENDHFAEVCKTCRIAFIGPKTETLGERDCSMQRRHQKLIEESPCPVMTKSLRKRMGEAAKRLCKAAGYVNAGTVEFLLDTGGKFYFMEVNARIQVEHPVTEMVTGIDLVKAQIRIASGEPLPWKQEDIKITGCAIECRINAEDSEDGFRPNAGKIERYIPPGGMGVRVDSHVYSGYDIPPHYDSMIGKLIVHGVNRDDAIATMKRALGEYVVDGVKTTIPFHREVMNHPQFKKGVFDTEFIENNFMNP